MGNRCFTGLSLGCLLCLLMFSGGNCINIEGWNLRAKSERTVHLVMPVSPGSTLTALTQNGSITIEGGNVTDCNLTATIIARAATEEDAKELAEQTQITLEPAGNRLTVKIEKPAPMVNRSVSVDLNVKVPNQVNLELTTHNGALRITNITGQIDATTHNGKVSAEKLSGNIGLKTHNGSIGCEEVSGDAQLRTYNGNVKVYYPEAAQPVCSVSVVTHNGGVEFTAPLNFSAQVEVSTHNGSIMTNLPITTTGKISRNKITGTIGDGQGKLHLETYNGSIKIK